MNYYSEETVKQMLKDTKVKTLTKNEYGNIVQDFRIVRPKIENYPSIKIPDKHGDLTERSLILDKVKDKWSKIYEEKGYDVMSDFWLALCEVIDCAPVILEANK